MERKNKKHFLVLLLLAISLLLFFLAFFIRFLVVLEKKEIPVTLEIGGRSGFDTNTTALTFGAITIGSTSQRYLNLENSYPFPINFYFYAKGDVKKFLIFDKIVRLEGGENKTIDIKAKAPDNESFGNYSGKMIIFIKKDI
ncbi:MAG: hypothetical protein KKF68_02440 [Nanoarchaeota archaeon]|nr:hypothetical protein [Nanoarchaeota archaeon]